MINEFNTWYDSLQEPWRFLLAMTLSMVGIVGLSSGSGRVMIASAIYLSLLLFIRIKGKINATS